MGTAPEHFLSWHPQTGTGYEHRKKPRFAKQMTLFTSDIIRYYNAYFDTGGHSWRICMFVWNRLANVRWIIVSVMVLNHFLSKSWLLVTRWKPPGETNKCGYWVMNLGWYTGFPGAPVIMGKKWHSVLVNSNFGTSWHFKLHGSKWPVFGCARYAILCRYPVHQKQTGKLIRIENLPVVRLHSLSPLF